MLRNAKGILFRILGLNVSIKRLNLLRDEKIN